MTAAIIAYLESSLKSLANGLPMLVVATFLIPKYLDYRRRPRLDFTARNPDGEGLAFRPAGEGLAASLTLGVGNGGISSQREWYWNLIVPEGLSPRLYDPDGSLPEPKREELSDPAGRRWVRFMGKVGDAVYPGRNYLFPYRVEIRSAGAEGRTGERLHYFFGTEYGLSPARAARLGNRLTLAKGFEGCLGSLTVRYPDPAAIDRSVQP